MSNVVPIRGVYESARLLLQQIAGDDEMDSFVLIGIRKDHRATRAQFNMNRMQMAFAAALVNQWVLEPGEELEG